MPSLPCPRCHAEVNHIEGQQPVCPACGLGAREEELAQHQEPAHHYPDAADPIEVAGGDWKVPAAVAAGLVAVALVSWAVFAAVDNGPGALNQEEAEQAALLAMDRFVADFEDPDGGELRLVRGDLSFDDGDFGAGSIILVSEWGRDDTGHFRLEVETDGSFSFRFALEAYCSPERDVLVLDGDAYEVRPDPDTSCMDLLSDDMGLFEDGLDLPDDRGANMTVTPHADGSVTARFHDADGDYVLEVDAQGRARSLALEADSGGGLLEMEYGARGLLDFPEVDGRFPSSVNGYCFFFEKTCTMDLLDGDDAPLDEFELRVYAADAEVGVDAPEETFPLFVGNATRNGFTFLLHEDGDGLLGDGDTITVQARSNDHKLVIWDNWAGRDVEDVPAPGPGVAWLLVALAAAFVLRR